MQAEPLNQMSLTDLWAEIEKGPSEIIGPGDLGEVYPTPGLNEPDANQIAKWEVEDRFRRVTGLARDLLVAGAEAEGVPTNSVDAKEGVLTCFWLAQHFENVATALALSYEHEGIPVGSSLGEFVATFLGDGDEDTRL